MFSVYRMVCAALLLCLVVGCGSGYEMATVKGKVTIGGNPVTGGTIVFSPKEVEEDAPNSTAIVQADGSFELEDGAVVGTHSVSLVETRELGSPDEEDDEEEDENEYAGARSLNTTATVASGENDLNIDFTL